MSKVVIYLRPSPAWGEFFLSADEAKVKLAGRELSSYIMSGSFESNLTGEAAAEDAFDLTNNPGREKEREEKYGRQRSMSSGDIAEVDGVKYLCMPVGWESL